ncbi:hypothetical protein BGS_1371 [Beggiatoa sp. SS]|nr:hypothetical protein BGS_1371 [Beggiatoa sp. SS]
MKIKNQQHPRQQERPNQQDDGALSPTLSLFPPRHPRDPTTGDPSEQLTGMIPPTTWGSDLSHIFHKATPTTHKFTRVWGDQDSKIYKYCSDQAVFR